MSKIYNLWDRRGVDKVGGVGQVGEGPSRNHNDGQIAQQLGVGNLKISVKNKSTKKYFSYQLTLSGVEERQ